jgi:methylenetetrahydrofolate dehydrogenase (NADP+) / methenyltetrahydrofolate cyclohydrolase
VTNSTCKILDGRKEADNLEVQLKKEVQQLQKKFNLTPKIAIILIGHNPASLIYVGKKQEKASSLNIQTLLYHLPSATTQDELHELIRHLNKEPLIHSILLQLPLPLSLDSTAALSQITPLKDVDCLTPENVGLFFSGRPRVLPCTPQGCLHLVNIWKKDITGLNALIIGRSLLVGSPVAKLLSNQNATTIQAHSGTKNLHLLSKEADIIISATGSPHLVKKNWIKPGACVIDVGIIKTSDGEIIGDVDFEEIRKVAGAISPVPGGVGPLTVGFLMKNIVEAAKNSL